jgi:hypothetical protein
MTQECVIHFLTAEDTANEDGEVQVPDTPNSRQTNTDLKAADMRLHQDSESQIKTSSELKTPDPTTENHEDVPGEMLKKRHRSVDYEPGTGM